MQGFADSIFWRFLKTLFPLDGGGGFAGDVVADPVDALDLVDDAHADAVQHVVGDSRPVGGHKVAGGDGAEGQGVVIGASVAHDAHGTGVGEDSKILVQVFVLAGLGDLVPEDEVGIPEQIGLLFGDLADDTDGQAGAGEGLAGDQILGQAQLPAQLSDLVLEQQAQGLDDLLEVHVVGQAAHVVVALDDGGVAGARLDHVGVDGALGQEVHGADLLGLLLKDPDELLADDLPLALGLRDTGQLAQEALLRVHPDEVDVPLVEGGLHLVPLVFPHEAVVHKDAGELFAHRLGQQGGYHGGVHAAGQSQEHLAGAHLLPDLLDGSFAVVPHGPVALGTAHLIEEVADHGDAVLRVVDLRVVLHPVEATGIVGDGHIGACVGVGGEGEALGHLGHIVPVAHPGDALLGQAPEQLAGGIVVGLGLAVLPGGVVLGLGDLAPQQMGHQLAAVADAQNGHAPGENFRVHLGGGVQIHAVGAAGEDDADGIHGLQLREGSGVGLDFAVHLALPHPAGDELVILSAEVQHDNSLMRHKSTLSHKFFLGIPIALQDKSLDPTAPREMGHREPCRNFTCVLLQSSCWG